MKKNWYDILKGKTYKGVVELGETVYQDGKISIENTNIENTFYICKSYDGGLSYEYYDTVTIDI